MLLGTLLSDFAPSIGVQVANTSEGAIDALFFYCKKTTGCYSPAGDQCARMKQRSNHQVDQKQDGRNEEQEQRTCFHR